jgi:hypothetical protein
MGRGVVAAVTNGRLDGPTELAEGFGTWERIFDARRNGRPVSLDGQQRKRRLIKIVGE